MADQGKKGFGNQKVKYGKGKGTQRLTNGISQTSPMSGMMNKEPNMEETALVGNRTRFTKHRTKVSKPNRLQGSHHPTKEMRFEGSTPMPSSEQI